MHKKNAVPAQYRQGDVMIERVEKLPADLTKVPRENSKIVLAQGKANGRSHVIDDPGSEMLQDKDGNRFLAIKGKKVNCRLPILSECGVRVLAQHPVQGKTVFLKTDIKMPARGGRPEIGVKGSFAFLRHDCSTPDHNAIAVARGSYVNVRQRNIILGDTRNVID